LCRAILLGGTLLGGILLGVPKPFKAPKLGQSERTFAMPSDSFTTMGEPGEFIATFGKSESFVVGVGEIVRDGEVEQTLPIIMWETVTKLRARRIT